MRRERHQAGSIYEASGSFYVRYRVTEMQSGKAVRVQKSEWLCDKDKQNFSCSCKSVKQKRDEAMTRVNARSGATNEHSISSYWTNIYLPFAEKNLRHSTLLGYKQIWSQHLESHFDETRIRDYTTGMASRFLTALAEKYGRRTLNHIRSCASAIFSHALNLEYVSANPWHGAKALGKIREPEGTAHYTLEEAENIVTALIDRPDAQLLFAFAFFMGLRPSEIVALQWGDIDAGYAHIRRACVRGHVDVCKTKESMAPLPIIQPIGGLLEMWRPKCPASASGWIFPSEKGEPSSPQNWQRRIIKPILKTNKIPWKGLYAGRRGAGTVLAELTGNLVAAQELLRHKSMTTTALAYKKKTQSALANGMKLLEAAAQK
jgi:integrase